jgi:SNF2 family DNA or RNA helicase
VKYEDGVVAKYKFKTKPFKHQTDALKECWNKESFALFMEMGTGKTKVLIDNLGVLFVNQKIDAALIIATKSVYTVWVNDEIPKHCAVPYEICLWKPTKEKTVSEFIKTPSQKCKILVMNVEAFSTKKGANVALSFLQKHDAITAIDESSTIKNLRAKRTKNILKLRQWSPYRRILTGTPVTKSPIDLYSQCDFLDPKHLGFATFTAFKNRYCIFQVLHTYGDKQINIPIGFKNIEELEAKVKAFSYRVKKEDCLDLPPKTYTKRIVHLTEEQKVLYGELKRNAITNLQGEYMTVNNVITEIIRLHQITAGFFKGESGIIKDLDNDKMRILLEIIEESEQKTIIWANWIYNIEQITLMIQQKFGPSSVVNFYGAVNSEDRSEAIRRFQNDPECRFFVANPSTGGYGLTLTKATCVIYYSNSFDAEHRLQSEERAHRIGQDKKVTYIDLITEGTVDEKIVRSLKTKFRLSAQTLGEVVRTWL